MILLTQLLYWYFTWSLILWRWSDLQLQGRLVSLAFFFSILKNTYQYLYITISRHNTILSILLHTITNKHFKISFNDIPYLLIIFWEKKNIVKILMLNEYFEYFWILLSHSKFSPRPSSVRSFLLKWKAS